MAKSKVSASEMAARLMGVGATPPPIREGKVEAVLSLKDQHEPTKRVEVRVTAKQKKLLALHRMTTGEGASAFFRRMIDQELEALYVITE